MSGKATFDGAPERGTINFSVGQPSADLLPLALLATAGQRFFADAEPLELNYGQRQGDARFRAALAAFLGETEGSPVDPDSLMLTGGISQALDFVCSRLAKAGDVVFVEEPSYPYSFQIFRDHGLEIVGVPVDGAGMDVAQLERELARRKPKLVYTIPAFHNPTGQVLDRARRERPRRAFPRARLRDHRRRGVPAPASRHAAAAVVRHALRGRQRARARHIFEDPRAEPAALAGSRRRPSS
jgi:DNA-binding transcriptional MocR family regulator